MRTYPIIISLLLFLAVGCHRAELITASYLIPALDSEEKVTVLTQALTTQLPNQLQLIESDIQSHTLTISFHEQLCRTMNVEQVIAEAGFAVNSRPRYDPKHTN